VNATETSAVVSHILTISNNVQNTFIQCFDAVGWAAGRASSL